MFCKIILPSNEIHKLPAVPKTYDDLYQTALRKFKGKIPDKFYFKYKDSDDELITLSSDEDFETAIVTSEADKVKTLRIFLIPEAALANVNPNCYLPNLMPASQESYSAENPLDKNIRGKNPAREPISQGYGRKPGDYPEGIDDFDINRLVEQLPGPVDRLKKSQSHPPQIENQEEMPSDRLSYDRTNFYDGSSRQAGRDIMGNPFNQDQMNVISDMLERKLKEKVEQRVHIAVNEIMGKLSEEFRTKPVKKNPYTHNPLMSKSVVPGFVSKPIIREPVIRESVTREPVVKAEKNQPDLNDYFCVNCKKKIEDVKYSCLDCANFDLCDQCEEKVDHAHSLLKTRLNKKTRPSMDLSDVSSVSQHQGVPTSQSTQDAGRYSSLMVSNKSQSNSYMKEEGGSFSANKNMANSSVAPGANQMIRFSNSMANINLPDKAETHNPYQAKNMSTFWNKNPIAMAQSMTYSKKETPKGFDTPGGEVKKYKAAIVKPPIYDLINVKPGHIYRVEFTIKNNGTEAWPETIKLLCINGVHKGTEEVLPALAPTEKFEVKLALKAPEEPNRYLSQWRLQYYEEGTPKPFGSNLFIEINVAEGHKSDNKKDGGKEPKDEKKEKAEKIEKVEKVEKAEKEVEKPNANKDVNNKLEKMASPISGIKEKEKEKEKPKDNDKERVKPLEIEKPSVQANEVKERVKLAAVEEVALLEDAADKSGFTPEERRLMKEKKCSEVVLRHAQALHSIYPDIDIEKQIDFVAECPIHLDINDIVMVYSTRVDQGFGMNF